MELDQDQAGEHARPRRAGRRMGPRATPWLALEPAPRRARSSREVRDARQDLQRNDGRIAPVADEEIAGTGGGTRRNRRLCAAGVSRGGRLQRSAAELDLSGRTRAAVRARDSISAGQEARRVGFYRDGAAAGCWLTARSPISSRNPLPPVSRPNRRSARVSTSRSRARVIPTYNSRRASSISSVMWFVAA